MSTLFRVQLPCRLYQEMLTHAQTAYPNECCGLLAGVRRAGSVSDRSPSDNQNEDLGVVTHHYPLLNELASPTEYQSDPRSHLRAEKAMRENGLDLLAIYHSHPSSEPVPSRKDIERNLYFREVHLIISLMDKEPLMRGWRLDETSYTEVQWDWIDDGEREA